MVYRTVSYFVTCECMASRANAEEDGNSPLGNAVATSTSTADWSFLFPIVKYVEIYFRKKISRDRARRMLTPECNACVPAPPIHSKTLDHFIQKSERVWRKHICDGCSCYLLGYLEG
jgi:hypothetical protein